VGSLGLQMLREILLEVVVQKEIGSNKPAGDQEQLEGEENLHSL